MRSPRESRENSADSRMVRKLLLSMSPPVRWITSPTEPASVKAQSRIWRTSTSSAVSRPWRPAARRPRPSSVTPVSDDRWVPRASSSGPGCAATSVVAPGTPITLAPSGRLTRPMR